MNKYHFMWHDKDGMIRGRTFTDNCATLALGYLFGFIWDTDGTRDWSVTVYVP